MGVIGFTRWVTLLACLVTSPSLLISSGNSMRPIQQLNAKCRKCNAKMISICNKNGLYELTKILRHENKTEFK